MAGEKEEVKERGLTKLELVFLVLTVGALGLSSVMFANWFQSKQQNSTLIERVARLDTITQDYHHQLSFDEMQFHSINLSLDVRRQEAIQFRKERDNNWSRLVGVCTELRVRGHDNHGCEGI